ncbi:galactose-6-phosphate isomerase LacA subunit [Streptococcus sanguinis SK1056]|uniref:Galactose-6-phosphate isomerase subunit LacA n=4 Tax=Streptococcus TaxID=1301 RepID=F3U921_STRSA|nr:galactose-6-phosphate isomerase LacA subunit [Streptococcus sanguinis SK1056]
MFFYKQYSVQKIKQRRMLMAIIIGADAAGSKLKDVVKDFLVGENFEVVDVTKEGQDFVDVTLAVAAEVNKQEENLGIVIDAYGAGPFMVATKIKGMVAAEVSDERSAYMTRGHNNSRMITMGAKIVGEGLAKNIAKGFVNGKYDGGRHQIRVDMLNKMC